MKTIKNSYCLVVLTILLLGVSASCSDERIEPKNNKTEYESAEEYLESKKQLEQEYEITEEGQNPLIGEEGTKIYGSKDLLMFANGDSVDFPYTIKLIELYTPKEMIYAEVSSIENNSLLTTHGEIRIRAYKDGEELVLRTNKSWQVEIPNNTPQTDMLIYYGTDSDSKVNWTNSTTTFETTTYGYQGSITKLGWVSCAQQAYESATTIDYYFVSDSISFNNLSVFIYLPEYEGLMQVFDQKSAPLFIGAEMKILILGKQGDELFSFYLEDTVSSDENTIEVLLQSTTDSEVTSILNSF
jgi:hypothetical protein